MTADSTPNAAPTDRSTTTASSTSTTGEALFTRADYMAHRCTHDQYYDQFVNRSVLSTVRSLIGEEHIVRSTHPHFNDIPLRDWDRLHELIKDACGHHRKALLDPIADMPGKASWSLSDTVCIAKAAARQIRTIGLEAQALQDEAKISPETRRAHQPIF